MPDGFVVLDKKPGMTSFSSLSAIKRCFGTRKVGHAGTLDMFASGVLICLVGAYTRLSDFFMASEKTYRARLNLGEETDTLDPEGTIVARAALPCEEAFRHAMASFLGPIMQSPPSYSAIHVNGQRASARARMGEDLHLPPRPVHIYKLELEKFNGKEAEILVTCSKGTYIRSLARDIAMACGSLAYLSALRRLASGPFTVEGAVAEAVPDDLARLDQSMAVKLGALPLEICEALSRRFIHGAITSTVELGVPEGTSQPIAVFSKDRLIGIVDCIQDKIVYRMVLTASS